MSYSTLTILVFIGLTISCCATFNECNVKLGEACPPQENAKRDPPGVRFLPDTALVDHYCDGGAVSQIRCITNFNDTCPVDFPINMEFRDMIPIIEDLCDETSELGGVYRDNIDCVNSNANHIRLAVEPLLSEMNRFYEHQRQIGKPIRENAMTCLVYRLIPRQATGTLMDFCGEGPVRFLQMLKKLVMKKICGPGTELLALEIAFHRFQQSESTDTPPMDMESMLNEILD